MKKPASMAGLGSTSSPRRGGRSGGPYRNGTGPRELTCAWVEYSPGPSCANGHLAIPHCRVPFVLAPPPPCPSSAIDTVQLSSVGCYTNRWCRLRLLGTRMKARRLIENASYAPDQLKALGQAFDDAWERIAPSVSSTPEAIEAARFALADIVLGLAKNGSLDPRWLAETAVHVMLSRSGTGDVS